MNAFPSHLCFTATLPAGAFVERVKAVPRSRWAVTKYQRTPQGMNVWVAFLTGPRDPRPTGRPEVFLQFFQVGDGKLTTVQAEEVT